MRAVHAAREHGAKIKKIITVVDREEGAVENMKRDGIEFIHVFTLKDFEHP